MANLIHFIHCMPWVRSRSFYNIFIIHSHCSFTKLLLHIIQLYWYIQCNNFVHIKKQCHCCTQFEWQAPLCFRWSELSRAGVWFLLCLGGTVYMVCRNKEKAESAREDIVKESGNNVSRICVCGLVFGITTCSTAVDLAQCVPCCRIFMSTFWICQSRARSGNSQRTSRVNIHPWMFWYLFVK